MQAAVKGFLRYLRIERNASPLTLKSYGTDLAGFTISARGFFVVGHDTVPNVDLTPPDWTLRDSGGLPVNRPVPTRVPRPSRAPTPLDPCAPLAGGGQVAPGRPGPLPAPPGQGTQGYYGVPPSGRPGPAVHGGYNMVLPGGGTGAQSWRRSCRAVLTR